jgi:hypothetical protein
MMTFVADEKPSNKQQFFPGALKSRPLGICMIIAPTVVYLDAGLNMFYFYFSVVGSFILLLLVFNIP